MNPAVAPPADVYIGLGANLGDPVATIRAALLSLAALPGTTLVATSSLYGSDPVNAQGPEFVNAVALVHTPLSPLALLAALQRVEAEAGRQRPYRNAPRTLDLDILLYGSELWHRAQLTLPHPRMHQRRFVLWPLSELAPQLVLPGLGPLQDWLPRVADQVVRRLPPEREAAGPPPASS